ncbi:helix-turn-helix domain-containing protein [Streptomyces sp. NPDC046866]|uniref:helix-turn-helix domain-containing protein n=1 Tax=Streptomyces sp. NPDC046866 TaxID=3154921 RepID=UPI0034551CA1
MTSKPLPPHGSEARYAGAIGRPACHCPTCVKGWTKAGQRRLLARIEGRPATIPSDKVTSHILKLQASGMSIRQIAAAADSDPTTVRYHAERRLPRIRRATAAKILAVQPDRFAGDSWVPAFASQRRCRALYAAGHGSHCIAAADPGLRPRTVEHLVSGSRQFITAANDRAVTRAYQLLSTRTGQSQRAINRARTEGWLGPAWWDDDEFGNPTYEPEVSDVPRYVAHVENCLELEQQGYSREQIAERLGITRDTLQRALYCYRQRKTAA